MKFSTPGAEPSLAPLISKHRFLRFNYFVFSVFNDQFEKLHETLEIVFHQVSRHLVLGSKTNRLRLVFTTHFSVFGNPDETLFMSGKRKYKAQEWLKDGHSRFSRKF